MSVFQIVISVYLCFDGLKVKVPVIFTHQTQPHDSAHPGCRGVDLPLIKYSVTKMDLEYKMHQN